MMSNNFSVFEIRGYNIRLELEKDPDWIYKPILKTNTKTTYDSDGIQQNILEEYEQLEEDDWYKTTTSNKSRHTFFQQFLYKFMRIS